MTKPRRWIISLAALAFVCAISALPARAEISGAALTVTAVNEAGDSATLQIPIPAGVASYTWTSNEITELRSPTTGDLIAILNPEGRQTSVEYVDDPSVALAFNVQAGLSQTNFSIASGLLSFPAMTGDGRATAGFSVTDFDGDGATLTGIGDPAGSQGAYLAQYNGFAGTLSGTTFAEVIHSIVAPSYDTGTANAAVPPLGFIQIIPAVNDMSVLVSFSLTALDLASGTSNFVIVPRPLAVEPTTWAVTKSLYR